MLRRKKQLLAEIGSTKDSNNSAVKEFLGEEARDAKAETLQQQALNNLHEYQLLVQQKQKLLDDMNKNKVSASSALQAFLGKDARETVPHQVGTIGTRNSRALLARTLETADMEQPINMLDGIDSESMDLQEASHEKKASFGTEYWKMAWLNAQFKFEGSEVVSHKCENSPDSAGCTRDPSNPGKGVDAAIWQCAVRKKIIDCMTFRRITPKNVPLRWDQLCGRLFLGQKPKPIKQCKGGLRNMIRCETDKECPGSKLTGGPAKCETFKNTVPGCRRVVQMACDKLALQQISAMGV